METKITIWPSGEPNEHQLVIKAKKDGKYRCSFLNVFKYHSDSFLKEYIDEEVQILELSIDAGVLSSGRSGLAIKQRLEKEPGYDKRAIINIIRQRCKVVDNPLAE